MRDGRYSARLVPGCATNKEPSGGSSYGCSRSFIEAECFDGFDSAFLCGAGALGRARGRLNDRW